MKYGRVSHSRFSLSSSVPTTRREIRTCKPISQLRTRCNTQRYKNTKDRGAWGRGTLDRPPHSSLLTGRVTASSSRQGHSSHHHMTIHKYERGPRITHNTPFAFVSHPPATARHPKKHPTPSSLPRASFAPHPSSRGPCFLIPRRGQGWRGGRTPSAWTRAWRRGPPPTGRRQLLLWTSGAVKSQPASYR